MRRILPLLLLLAAGPGFAAAGPDLSAGNLTLTDGTPGAGEPVFLSLAVTNQSPDPAGPFRVKAVLSPALPVTVRDAEIGSTEVASIPGFGEISVDLDAFIPAATAPGKYRLGAWIDPENLLLDGIRSNNGAATATFTVTRAPGAMALGDGVDAGLGPLGKDAMDFPIIEGAEATFRARGKRGVRPALRILTTGGAEIVEAPGGLLRWTAPATGTYRIEVSNAASTVGRVRLSSDGIHRVTRLGTTAPGEVSFPAWEDGIVRISALYAGDAAPLVFRPAAGGDVAAPGSARGRRARLGPLAPEATGEARAVLGGEGPVEVTVVSRTPRLGALLVR